MLSVSLTLEFLFDFSKVLSNPFDDIIPRITKAKEAITEKKGKSKSKATK